MNEPPMSSNPFDEDEKWGSQPIVWAILGITAMCCGVLFIGALFYFKPNAQSLIAQYFPSPTATPTITHTTTPTHTSTPTETPTPTPNLTATIQVQNALATATNAADKWHILIKDTFDSNKNKWQIKPSDSEFARTTYEIADGKYTWDITAHKAFIGWVSVNTKAEGDFYLSAEIKQSSGPDSADYGVIFREDTDSNFYYFGINKQGQYVLYLYNQEWSTLIDWTQSELIRPGESNRITVIGEGSNFIFFVNDQYLTEITDDTIKSGITALAIELTDADDHAVFEFDNVELRTPK